MKKISSNGSKVKDQSFKSILQKMMKITRNGNLKVANQSWDIFKPAINNINYRKHIGA